MKQTRGMYAKPGRGAEPDPESCDYCAIRGCMGDCHRKKLPARNLRPERKRQKRKPWTQSKT